MHRWSRVLVVLSILAVGACERAPLEAGGNATSSATVPIAAPSGEARAPTSAFLAGLFSPRDSTPATPRTDRKGPVPLVRVALGRGAIVLSGPDGYCIDPITLRSRGAQGFAVLASCRILTGGKAGPYVAPVLITVTVGGRNSGSDLPDPQTLAAISQSPLLAGLTREGLSLAHLGAGGEQILDGGDPRYWRGAFVQADRLVALALYAPDGSRLAGQSGAEMLQQVKSRIVSQSPPGRNASAASGG